VVEIVAERLLQDLRDLSRIGEYKTGVHRPTLSPADREARAWLRSRLIDAGLDARIDGIGNVLGYCAAPKRVLVGSHIESQPYAGRLDGALGVLYGIELARAFRDMGQDIGVDVGAWFDEEGYYGTKLGSRSFCDQLTPDELSRCRHRDDGTPLVDALRDAGLADLPREKIDVSRYAAYCEAHIEQGDWLDMNKLSIGVVTGIVGTWIFRIKATGVQNHAGSTRMAVRKDAGLALCRLAVAINDELPEVAGERSVWTTGRLQMFPGVYTIIPGLAKMDFQFRDVDPDVLQRMHDRVDAIINRLNAAGPCQIEYTIEKGPPAPMARHLQDKMAVAAEALAPGRSTRMPSASGHDATIFSFVLPAAMLFVPSIGGVSHHFDEDTKPEDIVLGCRVFAKTVESVLSD
jgi:beta-ureidopropionase / N-carbamoyl-L-amino-acid hydrolase